MMDYLPCLYSFIMCFAYCYRVHLKGKNMFFAALGGTLGWFVFLLFQPLHNDLLQYFFGTVAFSAYAELMARINKCPVTGFLIISMLPMVPGSGIYQTMEYAISGNTDLFLETGMHTLGIAGSLAIGVLLVSSTMRLFVNIRTQRLSKKQTGTGEE